MGNNYNDFVKKFKTKELLIYESKFWVWSLRPVQSTLGAGILSLKRECLNLGELSQDEFSDLGKIVPLIEETLKKTFNYDIMNYLMLMMVDKHIHYHVIPRYQNSIMFSEKEWIDTGWPKLPDLSETIEEQNQIIFKIIEIIKNNLVVNGAN